MTWNAHLAAYATATQTIGPMCTCTCTYTCQDGKQCPPPAPRSTHCVVSGLCYTLKSIIEDFMMQWNNTVLDRVLCTRYRVERISSLLLLPATSSLHSSIRSSIGISVYVESTIKTALTGRLTWRNRAARLSELLEKLGCGACGCAVGKVEDCRAQLDTIFTLLLSMLCCNSHSSTQSSSAFPPSSCCLVTRSTQWS